MSLALIDGDIAAYRAAAVTQSAIKWEDSDEPNIYANPREAIKAAILTIRMWIDGSKCSKALVLLTGDGNFRKAVLPSYKSNRATVAKPIALKAVREAIEQTFPTAMVPGLEADDLMGLAMTDPRARGNSVIVSMDKDMRTIPGMHLNPSKEKAPVYQSLADANRYWFMQALMGDTSDGYVGCPGIGPKKAALALEGWAGVDLEEGYSRLQAVYSAYHSKAIKDPDELATTAAADALCQLRVARILRHGDYDKKTKEVSLWTPEHSLPMTVSLADLIPKT